MARIAALAAMSAGIWMGVSATAGAARAADVVVPAAVAPAPLPVVKPFEFSLVAYGWATGLKGDLATLPPLPAVHADISFGKVLENLEGTFMGAAELKYGRFLFLTDLMYSRIGTAVSPRGPLFDRASLNSTSLIGTIAAGYRLVEDPRYTIDAMAGVRGYSMGTRIRTTSSVAALNLYGNDTETWADPIVGLKARYNVTDAFYLTSWAFVGGFGAGSKISWDVFGGVGYSFNERISAVIGYRALGIDYSRNGFVYDVVQKGPISAFVFRF